MSLITATHFAEQTRAGVVQLHRWCQADVVPYQMVTRVEGRAPNKTRMIDDRHVPAVRLLVAMQRSGITLTHAVMRLIVDQYADGVLEMGPFWLAWEVES